MTDPTATATATPTATPKYTTNLQLPGNQDLFLARRLPRGAAALRAWTALGLHHAQMHDNLACICLHSLWAQGAVVTCMYAGCVNNPAASSSQNRPTLLLAQVVFGVLQPAAADAILQHLRALRLALRIWPITNLPRKARCRKNTAAAILATGRCSPFAFHAGLGRIHSPQQHH